MPKWTQFNIFTGEPIPPCDDSTDNQQRIPKITQLALQVQLSIARLDPLTDTMKLISELCEQITGITYPVDINVCQKTYQKKRQQQTERAVTAETQPSRKAGRPKTTQCRNPRRYFNSKESQNQIAKDVGLAQTTVHNIIHRLKGQP